MEEKPVADTPPGTEPPPKRTGKLAHFVAGTQHRFLGEILRKRVRDPEHRNEILQRVYLKLLRAPDSQVGSIRDIKAFLTTCMNRTISDYYRSVRKRYVDFDSKLADETQVPDMNSSPEFACDDHEHDRLLNAAIAKLSDEWRRIFVLRSRQGLRFDAIASITGMKEGTVEQYYGRACRQVARALGVARPTTRKVRS